MTELATPSAEAPPPAPKVDPETLVIRAAPARAIRFKRGFIVSLVASAVIVLIVIAWFALKPHVFHVVANEEALSDPATKAASDALGGLPKSYGDVPRLGPPLPGDLGKPILEHQQSLAVGTETAGPDMRAQAEQAERERQLAELKAARQSGLLAQAGSDHEAAPTPVVATAEATPSTSAEANKPALDPDRNPNGQQCKADFVAAREKDGGINSHLLTPAVSPHTLAAGSVIAASLMTGLRSDLPGLVVAQVTENVYDSATGQTLLVPQGARLIGKYDSVVAFGQKRALVVWQRIGMPDGSSLALDNVPATDAEGYAGLADKVDFHTWSLLKGVVLSTLLGVGTELQFSGESNLVQALRQSTQQGVAHAGDQLTSKTLSVLPTITIRPGTPVRLVVHKDLVLAPWRG